MSIGTPPPGTPPELARYLTELATIASQSKLRERAPDEFNAFVQRITESSSAPADMFIDAEVLVIVER